MHAGAAKFRQEPSREASIFTFDDIVAPVDRETFLRDYYRRKPAHFPAAAGRDGVFSLDGLNGLLSQSLLWNERNLKMWADCKPVHPDHYTAPMQTLEGMARRPDPAKVEAAFARGATLVLNDVDCLTPALRAVANALEQTLLGLASANVYCSPGGRQAFASHYDDHEVFAFHIAGEKRWRVYEGRLDNPVGQPAPRPDLQQLHDRSKGEVLFEAVMRPGDLIYLPRGQYHDALASTDLSLHVTFSVIPMNGLALFSVLEKAAIADSLFRDDLPNPATPEGRAALAARLGELRARIGAMMSDDAFIAAVESAQRERIRRRSETRLGGGTT